MSRERDIRNGIAELIETTGEFDEAYLGSWEERGRPTSDIKAVCIEPDRTGRGQGWDDEITGGWEYNCKISLDLAVRIDDPIQRDEEVERLLGVLQNTLNGVSIAGFTLAQKTYITDWTWVTPLGPERHIKAVLQADYLVEGDEIYDVSP